MQTAGTFSSPPAQLDCCCNISPSSSSLRQLRRHGNSHTAEQQEEQWSRQRLRQQNDLQQQHLQPLAGTGNDLATIRPPTAALCVGGPQEQEQTENDHWSYDETGEGRTSSDEEAGDCARGRRTHGDDDSGSSPKALSSAARGRQRTVPQQPQLHLRMRIKPRTTYIGSARLERLPLPFDRESQLKCWEQFPQAYTSHSMWTSLVTHARRSLPFLGGDDLEGALPPTPKPAIDHSSQIHQLGCSVFALVPAAWTGAQSSSWQKDQIAPGTSVTCAEVYRHVGNVGTSCPTISKLPRRHACQSSAEGRSRQGCLESVAHRGRSSISPSAPTNEEKNPDFCKWRSRRVTFDAPDLTALVFKCFRRRLSAMVLLVVSSILSFVLLYYSFSSSLWLLTVFQSSPSLVALGDVWESGSPSSAELQLASAASVQLRHELQNLRPQVQNERKDLHCYGGQMHSQLNIDSTAALEGIRDNVVHPDRRMLSVNGVRLKIEENGEAPGARDCHGEVNEGWEESLLAIRAQLKDLVKNDARITADMEGLRKRLEEAAANHRTSTTLGDLKLEWERTVKEFHSILNEDERIDWALESLGASIITSETVSSLAYPAVPWGLKISSYLEELVDHGQQAGGGGRVIKKPNVMLQPDTHPGNCYPFDGEKGNITILLPTAIFITAVAVDGVASKQFTASTPRKFTLWGYEDPRLTSGQHEAVPQHSHTGVPSHQERTNSGLGSSESYSALDAAVESPHVEWPLDGSWWENATRVLQWLSLLLKSPVRHEWDVSRMSARKLKKIYLGEYELRKPQRLSIFELEKKHTAPLRKVTFEFSRNFGHSYTCVYRLRVHGEKIQQSTARKRSRPSVGGKQVRS